MRLLFSLLAIILLTACNTKQNTNDTQAHIEGGLEHYVYKDSTERVHMLIDVTVPVASDSASTLIRDALLRVIDLELAFDWENNRTMKAYNGEDKSLKAFIDYYGNNVFKDLNEAAEEDYNDRKQYLDEDTTITEEERKQRMIDTPQWEHESKIIKEYETPKHTVYEHNTYQYLGGAHGGVGGCGSLTFDATGKKIDKFFVDGAEKRMQKLLIKGLMNYFNEDNAEKPLTEEDVREYLQIEGNIIPLPERAPYLSADGVVLTYQQYEIAAYAAGMPSFIISYNDAMPFLTDEVKALIDIKH